MGVGIGVTIFLLPRKTAPAWADELNPITRRPYTSPEEYEEVRRLSPQEILQRQQGQITNTKPVAPPAPSPQPQPQAPPDPKCDKIAARINDIINAERKETPKGGFPQGRKGIAERWREIAENKGKWGRKPDGELIDKVKNHFAEYGKGQKELIDELINWTDRKCEEKGHTLPRNARQYAAQKPELGPGKPLEPAPTPTWSMAVPPAVNIPKDGKRAK
ncbi:MAG: hypothetical protein IPM54_22915 [Polyangiaceae bacterium]|nr:hypothetical protein [Polyangiaceae bacterium]